MKILADHKIYGLRSLGRGSATRYHPEGEFFPSTTDKSMPTTRSIKFDVSCDVYEYITRSPMIPHLNLNFELVAYNTRI